MKSIQARKRTQPPPTRPALLSPEDVRMAVVALVTSAAGGTLANVLSHLVLR